MKLCKCGCGQETKGHLSKGTRGKFVEVDYLRGHNKSRPTEKTRQKLVESHKGQIAWNKGKSLTEEHKEKLRISHLGQRPNRRGFKHTSDSIEKMRMRKLGKVVSLETKEKMRATLKRKWESPIYAEKMIKAWKFTPNKQEIKLLKMLETMYPGEWKFVGDGQVIIAGRCPDFINVNGQKKIIELFGDYWHKGENPQNRADLFKPFGYETLVIWENEMKYTNSVKDRIERFCGYAN